MNSPRSQAEGGREPLSTRCCSQEWGKVCARLKSPVHVPIRVLSGLLLWKPPHSKPKRWVDVELILYERKEKRVSVTCPARPQRDAAKFQTLAFSSATPGHQLGGVGGGLCTLRDLAQGGGASHVPSTCLGTLGFGPLLLPLQPSLQIRKIPSPSPLGLWSHGHPVFHLPTPIPHEGPTSPP